MEDDGQEGGGVAGEGRQDTVGLALASGSHPGEWGNAQVGRFSGKNINLRGRGGDGDIKLQL